MQRWRVPLGFACAALFFLLARARPGWLMVGGLIALPGLAPFVRAADTLDFTGRLAAIAPENIFRDPGYYVWCGTGIRGEDGKFAPFELAPPPHPEFYGMGHALYSTAGDYMRFLRMFLNKGALDGKRVLSEKGVATMLANHIGDLRVGKMTTAVAPVTADVDLFPGTPKTHSLGFLRVEQDVPGMRSAGSQGGAGVLNTHFWFDPAKDVAGTIMTQTLPFVEPPFLAVYEKFERAVYAAG